MPRRLQAGTKGAHVLAPPAAIPDTCVPCSWAACPSKLVRVSKTFATMTLLLTKLHCVSAMPTAESIASHFGNPARAGNVLSVRKGCVWSIAVSIMPILTPAPALLWPPTAFYRVGGPMIVGELFMHA